MLNTADTARIHSSTVRSWGVKYMPTAIARVEHAIEAMADATTMAIRQTKDARRESRSTTAATRKTPVVHPSVTMTMNQKSEPFTMHPPTR